MKKTDLSFLKEEVPIFLCAGLFLGIFGIIYNLYDIEWEAYLYATVLCIFVLVILLLFRYLLFLKGHRMRTERLAVIEQDYHSLPSPGSLCEADYQKMVTVLGQRCRELSTKLQTNRQESMDYYTTWVHQIKTPIGVMQMILQSEDTEEHRELSAELFRISQYVDMVLSYIRLGSESNDLVFQEYELDPLIRQCIRKYASQFIRSKIHLIYEGCGVSVLTDEKWLCFILEQLLSNAIKYTPKGSITISVSPEKVLTIRDTGIGIASEDLPRIFEKGFTGYNGRTDKKSTGLGLYLCRQAAYELGIRISASSEPKNGTAICLDLAPPGLQVE